MTLRNDDPLSVAGIRAEIKMTARKNELIAFGAASGMATVGGLLTLSCAASLFTSSYPAAHMFLGFVGASGALFFGRAAIRSYRGLLFKAMTDTTQLMTLQLENDNYRGRLWDLYLGVDTRAAGESGGSRSVRATSPAANVFPINGKPRGRFQ